MQTFDTDLPGLDGKPLRAEQFNGRAVLVVNVASRCGFTPQYEGLERLQKQFGDRGFTVLGVPSGQFGDQELGTSEAIAEFCASNYGTTFPMTEKLDVNGPQSHPLYQALRQFPDAAGAAGDVQWNFEKFLVSPSGEVVARFRSAVEPEADEIVSAIEGLLA